MGTGFRRGLLGRGLLACLGVVVSLPGATDCSRAWAQGLPTPSITSLPVPRYVSLKSDRVNLRSGPGTEYPTSWVYRRAGLPLEILKEYEGWRQVRDADGASGWVVQSFLSGRRTALIEPWEVKAGVAPPQIAVFADESEKSTLVANVEAGVIANVLSCNGKWCRITVDPFKGYVPQKRLWGVYASEVIK
jgi:SH3-like domain-containing protein